MADFPTFGELFDIERDEMLARNGNLTLDVIQREGADSNIIAAGGASVGDEAIGQLSIVEAALYLDSAQDEALDRLVFDRYSLLRKPASPAVGSVQFTTLAAAAAQFAIPVGTKLQTFDGEQFATIVSANFPQFSVGPITVAVQSILAGLSQQSKANTITSIVSNITGAPGDLKVNNPLATAGAVDRESDASLRNRARQFFTTARRGTLAAIQTAALAVPGVETAEAFEVIDAFGRPAKGVQLVISDAFTDQLADLSPTPPLYAAQSQVLADTVFLALSDVRAAGIFVDVTVAIVELQGVDLGLRFQAGVNPDTVALEARSVIAAFINSLSPGQPMLVSDLIQELRLVTGLIVTGQEILSPAGDVFPLPLQVLRSSLSLIVAVSLQPTRAIQSTTNPDVIGQ